MSATIADLDWPLSPLICSRSDEMYGVRVMEMRGLGVGMRCSITAEVVNFCCYAAPQLIRPWQAGACVLRAGPCGPQAIPPPSRKTPAPKNAKSVMARDPPFLETKKRFNAAKNGGMGKVLGLIDKAPAACGQLCQGSAPDPAWWSGRTSRECTERPRKP